MSKLVRPTFAQRDFRRWGELLLASGVILWLAVARLVAAQAPPVPRLKGGVEERSVTGRPVTAPPARPQDEEDCTAFHNLVDLERKALGSAQVTQSQAWRDTKEKWEKVYIEPSRASIRLEGLLNCGCPVVTSLMFIEKYWKIRNDPDGPVPGHPTLRNRDTYRGNPDDLLKYAQYEVGAVEDCFKKACETEDWRTETYPQYKDLKPQPLTPRYPSGRIRGKLEWNATVYEQQDDRGQMIKVQVHRVGSCQFDLTFKPDGSAYANSVNYQNVDTSSPFSGMKVVETTVTLQTPFPFSGHMRVAQSSGEGNLYWDQPSFSAQSTRKVITTEYGQEKTSENYPVPLKAFCDFYNVHFNSLHDHLID